MVMVTVNLASLVYEFGEAEHRILRVPIYASLLVTASTMDGSWQLSILFEAQHVSSKSTTPKVLEVPRRYMPVTWMHCTDKQLKMYSLAPC